MTLHQTLSKEAVKGVAVGATPRDLAAIWNPDCAAAIWQREPLHAFQHWIEGLTPFELPRARVILRPAEVRQAMTELCASYSLAPCEERAMLVDDVAALADVFAQLMQAPFVRLRLDVISTNACRKFHVDTLTARLICTYRGSGTQYGISWNGRDPARVFTAATGSAIVLRGKLWPAEASPELVHRSPPIEGTGEARLVLVLDPIMDLEEAREEEFRF
ncbi:MAG: DUF1826 domain-containing protein [Pseudomonadota bacterium]